MDSKTHSTIEGARYIPCNVCHRAQGIISLGDGDSGNLVHSNDSGFLLGQHIHQLRVLSRVDEAD